MCLAGQQRMVLRFLPVWWASSSLWSEAEATGTDEFEIGHADAEGAIHEMAVPDVGGAGLFRGLAVERGEDGLGCGHGDRRGCR